MTLTADEQELLNFGVGALPDWIAPDDPLLRAAAKVIGAARATGDYLFKQALITTADGPTATSPDWINQHARDRGTSRQAGEGDDALRARLRNVPDAITRDAILTAANAVLIAAGVSGQAVMLELPRDAAYIGTHAAIPQGGAGVGGSFAHFGSMMVFTPTPGTEFVAQPWVSPSVFPGIGFKVLIQNAVNAANNGAFDVTGMLGNGIVYNNTVGVNNAADATAFGVIFRFDRLGAQQDPFARAYVNRGYRVTNGAQHVLLLILPFGTDAGTQASVLEAVRLKKAAGFKVIVERRLNP